MIAGAQLLLATEASLAVRQDWRALSVALVPVLRLAPALALALLAERALGSLEPPRWRVRPAGRPEVLPALPAELVLVLLVPAAVSFPSPWASD